ncbi:MAG: NAD+ synthase [Rhodothermales bacterium]|nr:NAD+ synthase [Rhodothermales bacterium]
MKIALAQINPTVGDIDGNVSLVIDFAQRAAAQGADLAVFPELCICGYPPLDLLENESFIDACAEAVETVALKLAGTIAVIVGAPVRNKESVGKRLFNAALLLEDGRRVAEVHKSLLPTYDIFDEFRYFEPAHERSLVEWRGLKLGLHVCEDMWNNEEQADYHLYRDNPIDELAELGADLFVNISASPFSVGKHARRNEVVEEICREHGIPFVLVNQVGANTEVVFDGDSRIHDAQGNLVACAVSFDQHLLIRDMDAPSSPLSITRSSAEQLYGALTLGIRDYFNKTGAFNKTLVGLSGGIDSAVTCALAVAALGPDRVVGITMPSVYSSAGSVTDSEELAGNLGIEFHSVGIEPAVSAFGEMLEKMFKDTEPGIAEENIQARARGLTLMAVSNKFGHLLLSTGNKSEMSVGYATLYGDMNGGLAVLADVYKRQVYELADYINFRAGREVIPRSTIEKAPSAELRPDQKDSDSLPDYEVLDSILRLYVEEQRETADIVARTGFDTMLVQSVLDMVDRNEYKRRQAAPGIRVSTKAFGIGRRVPIVMRWNRRVSPHSISEKTP